MNSILRALFVFTFFAFLSSACMSKNLLASSCCGTDKDGEQTNQAKEQKAEPVKDPVCNMEVSDTKKAPSEEYKGKVYYFCSEHCKKSFKKDPASYIK